ncbi:MAG: hypothetical protein NVS2B12_00620 [Ktedonobacteraceae bacterium]
MIKAVVAALVLIIGAAVVLWYGNTLNSWVLGGLIGGLAALLLSIPISLTIFSFLSRRHDEQAKTNEEMYQEDAYQQGEYAYHRVSGRAERAERSMYVVEEDHPRSRRGVWGEDEIDEDDFYGQMHSPRQQPPQTSPGLLAPNQPRSLQRLPPPQRGALNSKQLPATPKQLPERSTLNTRPLSAREREITSRRPTQQKMNYPGYQTEVPHSQLRSQALRTARLEAAKQREDDEIEELPTYRPRRSPVARPSKPLPERRDDEQSIQQGARQYPRRPRRIVDASPSQNDGPRALLQPGENITRQGVRRQQPGPETDYIDPAMTPSNADLTKPLVRRAPYMYEDDPLRKQLSQHVDGPITRRSSRNLANSLDEE